MTSFLRSGPGIGRPGLAMFLLAGAFVPGCGYSARRPFPTDIRTIHVDLFQSREFRRELEFRLTEALVKRIEMDTPYRIVPRDRADAVLTGEIVSVRNRALGDDFETDLPREIGSVIEVRFRLQDLRSGAVLVERPRYIHQTGYIPPVGETLSEGMVRGLDGMAERIVESMESDF